MTAPTAKPKGTALAVWRIYGFWRPSVLVGRGITPRDPHRHPFRVVRHPK